MEHTLPELPYAYDALEPWIDAKTMELHHGKHHATYVAKLNEALAKHPDIAGKPLEELLANLAAVPEDIRGAVRNHGGGHFNHSFFWAIMAPKAGGKPTGMLAAAFDASFGSFVEFQKAFSTAALGVFGSGWGWLVTTNNPPRPTSERVEAGKQQTTNNGMQKLQILTTANQDTPLALGVRPLLCLDVWEHAYYLKHQNRRADYIEAWWHVVNWEEVGRHFSE